MDEIEVPTEHIHEELHHAAKHGERWLSWVALSSALLAALAAAAALLAGHHANEAMIDRIQAANQWSYYQAKSVKANLLDTKRELLVALGRKAGAGDEAKAREYENDREAIAKKAEGLEKSSEAHLDRHMGLARSVTLFQIAIAVGAIAALSSRKPFFWVSLVFGVVGLISFISSLL